MRTQVMLDLETLGQRPGSVIVAIGAVKFGGGQIFEEFYKRITAESCEEVGLRMDVSTVLWWLSKSDEARAEITQPGTEPLQWALESFTSWIGNIETTEVWGHGPSFDCAILAAAYYAMKMPLPWDHRRERCCRTIFMLRPDIPFERTGTLHNALEDARTQAVRVMKILAALPPTPTLP